MVKYRSIRPSWIYYGKLDLMTTEQLDTVHTAKPFRAFTLHLADGTKHEVAHPELMWRTPGGRTVFVSLGGERVAIVDLLLVTQITYGNGSNGRRRRRS
jgi:hypothetical protein